MSKRLRACLFVVLLVLLAFVLFAPRSMRSQESWTPPRTPDGQPDLQGIWTSPTLTPFERPAEFKDKAFLTKEEAAQWEAKAARSDAAPAAGDPGNYNALWFDSGTSVVKTMRTSLVIDPIAGAGSSQRRGGKGVHETSGRGL